MEPPSAITPAPRTPRALDGRARTGFSCSPIMKIASFFGLIVLVGASAPGCGIPGISGGCTEIGCADQVQVELGKLGSKFASGLPLQILVCIDGKTCDSFMLAASSCTVDNDKSASLCLVQPDGSVSISPQL